MANKNSFFWISYSDLMTSLFFIMLVLFVFTVGVLVRHMRVTQEQFEATKYELEKIKEIDASIEKLDDEYFKYLERHKKHVLRLSVVYDTGESDIYSIEDHRAILPKLREAGHEIENIVNAFKDDMGIDVQYLVIIEGQASRIPFSDPGEFRNNEVLSYQRALALKEFWLSNGIDFESNPRSELIVAGSGEGGVPREPPDDEGCTKNQRFLIHVIPKPGVIHRTSSYE